MKKFFIIFYLFSSFFAFCDFVDSFSGTINYTGTDDWSGYSNIDVKLRGVPCTVRIQCSEGVSINLPGFGYTMNGAYDPVDVTWSIASSYTNLIDTYFQAAAYRDSTRPFTWSITITYLPGSGVEDGSGSGSGDSGSGSGGSGSGSGTATGSGTLQNGNLSFTMSGPWALESTLQDVFGVLRGHLPTIFDITDDLSSVLFLTDNINTNISSISSATSSVATNTFSTALNSATISTNTASIASNTSSIATNTGTIASHMATTASNTGTIVTNTGTIATNTGTIATNTGTTASNTGTIASNTTTIKNDVASMKSDLSALKDAITQSNTSPSPPQRLETLPVPSSVPALTTIKNKLFPPSFFPSSSKQRFSLVINMPAPSGGYYHLSMDFPMSSTSIETQNGTVSLSSEMVTAINGFFSLFRTGLLILLVWCFVKVVIKTLRQW